MRTGSRPRLQVPSHGRMREQTPRPRDQVPNPERMREQASRPKVQVSSPERMREQAPRPRVQVPSRGRVRGRLLGREFRFLALKKWRHMPWEVVPSSTIWWYAIPHDTCLCPPFASSSSRVLSQSILSSSLGRGTHPSSCLC